MKSAADAWCKDKCVAWCWKVIDEYETADKKGVIYSNKWGNKSPLAGEAN